MHSHDRAADEAVVGARGRVRIAMPATHEYQRDEALPRVSRCRSTTHANEGGPTYRHRVGDHRDAAGSREHHRDDAEQRKRQHAQGRGLYVNLTLWTSPRGCAWPMRPGTSVSSMSAAARSPEESPPGRSRTAGFLSSASRIAGPGQPPAKAERRQSPRGRVGGRLGVMWYRAKGSF